MTEGIIASHVYLLDSKRKLSVIMAMNPKHPEIHVQLSDQNGNAFMIIGVCLKAARDGGLSQHEIDTFLKEATSGTYEELLQTAMRWFSCC